MQTLMLHVKAEMMRRGMDSLGGVKKGLLLCGFPFSKMLCGLMACSRKTFCADDGL